jgi:osmotically-inducible protein OsmY
VVTLTGEVESWQEKNLAERVSASVKGVREIKNDLRIVYKGPRKDHEIRADVAQRLENDVYVEESGIKVQVKDATVELIGVVGSAAEKQRARMDAWVAGTQKVNAENLKVKWRAQQSLMRKKRPENISDSGVARAVKDAYLFDPRLVAGNVNVRVDDGIAVLTGQVSDLRAKKAATETALNTVGVYHVRNLIDVRPQTRVSDDTLVQRVSAAIDRDPYLSANKVTVKAINGKVYLNGNVENRFRKKHAASIAGRIDGVVSVQNNLIANQRWSRKQDWWLKREVEAQLLWDPFLPRRAIAVTVDRGTVILSGTVRGWLQRMKAEQDAWRAGAKEVQTRIRIENGPKALQP